MGDTPWLVGLLIVFIYLFTIQILWILYDKCLREPLSRYADKTETIWDDILVEQNFVKYILIYAVILIYNNIIGGYLTSFRNINNIVLIADIVVIVINNLLITLILISSADSWHVFYKHKDTSKETSIHSFVQALNIMICVIMVIYTFVKLFDISQDNIFAASSGIAAVIVFIFRDTILGFISSLYLTSLDIIRLNDWIEIPTKKANGLIKKINLFSVCVHNWDNTETYIPIYSLMQDSFISWRNMFDDEKTAAKSKKNKRKKNTVNTINNSARRFLRILNIDVTSIKTFDDNELEKIKSNPIFEKYYENMSLATTKTNIALFRIYVESMLKASDDIIFNEKWLFIVTYLSMEDTGLPLKICVFTKETHWEQHEKIVSKLCEEIIYASSELGIRLYQRGTPYTNIN